MPKVGQTGLAIPVPEADALLASVAAQHSGTVREGVAAHVSLLYPFLAAAELDESVTRALSELFAEQAAMPVRFPQCHRRAGFVYLRPDPVDRLEELTTTLRRRWPDVVPYGGIYNDDVGPHLTVAMCGADESTAGVIEQHAAAMLPIAAELTEAWLVIFEGQWILRERFMLGFSAPDSHAGPGGVQRGPVRRRPG